MLIEGREREREREYKNISWERENGNEKEREIYIEKEALFVINCSYKRDGVENCNKVKY